MKDDDKCMNRETERNISYTYVPASTSQYACGQPWLLGMLLLPIQLCQLLNPKPIITIKISMINAAKQ